MVVGIEAGNGREGSRRPREESIIEKTLESQRPSSNELPGMPPRRNIDSILKNWPFVPGEVNARTAKASDGRTVLQMRVDLGLLQMEVTHRPDGERPNGYDTYFDYLKNLALEAGGDFELDDDQCSEADREFLQFYHRRICWLELQEFRRAVLDADHTLDFMDFVRDHSPSEEWTLNHEQYRPFVIFQRTQAVALAELDETGPEGAVEEINGGLQRLRAVFSQHDVEEAYDEDEFVIRLRDLRESIREHYDVGKTLRERLAEAVAAEEYELAAKLRDELAKRGSGGI